MRTSCRNGLALSHRRGRTPTYKLPMPPCLTMERPMRRKARVLVIRPGGPPVRGSDISTRVFMQSHGMLVMQAAAPEIAPAQGLVA